MQDSSYRKLNFALVDVFAGEPLRGNPLAVVDDGTGLDEEAIKAAKDKAPALPARMNTVLIIYSVNFRFKKNHLSDSSTRT